MIVILVITFVIKMFNIYMYGTHIKYSAVWTHIDMDGM